jgi:uncharacterized repeat protein (TIGR01451 family)
MSRVPGRLDRASRLSVRVAAGCLSVLLTALAGLAAAAPPSSEAGTAAAPAAPAKGPKYVAPAQKAQGYELIEYQDPPSTPDRAGSAHGRPHGGMSARKPLALNGGFDGLTEVEPNNTSATATPLADSTQITGTVFPPAPPAATTDVDFYSFTANVGDRIYAATQTLWDASASGDTVLELIAADGTTVLETDNNDGTFNASSSTIAGFAITTAGQHFLRVRHNVATGSVRPYSLHFHRQTTAPVAEVEANNTPATANPLPASGHVTGTISAVSPGESDFYSINLNAGDTVFLSLDMNPERDAAVWNGRLGFALFGNPPANQILLANDANAGAAPADPNSEAFFFTVKDAGTYFVYIDSIVAAGLGATATYNLSVSVQPALVHAGTCTTYTSTDVPIAIPTGPGLAQSTITVPGNPRIDDLNVTINLNHTFMQDLDVHLVSPAGNDNGLFTDIGAATVGGPQTLMDITLDDEAGLPFAFAMSSTFHAQPELAYRLNWFDGEDAGGTWTLVMRDDATGDGGTLNSWSIRVCEPPPPPTCAAGFIEETVYSTDFEADDGGFTHSGTQDEWQRGLPTFAPITTCASGVNCFKTDLVNTYNASSSQDLLSPNIDLAGYVAPVRVRWAQRYHIESANFDHYSVDAREVGGANPIRMFEWLGATMNNTVGNPAVTINESAGWAVMEARADALAGLNSELLFHLDSDTTVQLTGVGVDDVSVSACRLQSADLSITKTDGVATATPGGSVTYTITASNAGPDAATGATVADTFPASLTCTWTCVGAGGGTCTAAGSGNISDTVNLPAGGSVTYTASCTIAASATGTLVNTATVSSSVTDPDPANNSATDTDTLTPSADLSITKTDGVATATPGGSVTYTITASNAGLSDAPGATVADTFPASLTCNTTCVGAGGGTCTAGPFAGNISDSVNLPAGGSVTYTSTCAIAANATGTLSNTATVSSGVTDPDPVNNSATDVDTLTPEADLSITKTDGVATATPGGSVTYTITASNAGLSDAPGATVADTFPAELTCTWTCVGAGGGTCTAAGSGNISDTVNLPAGGSTTYTASCTVSTSASGSLSNTATLAAPAGVTDPNPANNSATDVDTVTPQTDLSITKTDGVTSATAGGSVTYTITASNAGPSNATGANVTDTFPAELTCTWTCVGAGGGTCTAAGSGNISDTVNLPAGGSITYTASCTISAAATGSLVNTATVEAAAGAIDPDPANNSATDTDALGAETDLSITKTDGVTSVLPGATVTYTIVASNAGPSAATGATVSDTFAASLTCSTTCVGAGGGTCTAGPVAGNINDTVNLPMGGTATYTATCTLSASATGTLVNTATIAAPASATDPVPGNNSATDTDTITDQADLSVTLGDVPDPVGPGGTLTYTAVVTNNGPSAANNVAVAIPLDADTTFVAAAPGAGSCTTPAVGATGTVNCTWAGATANGATQTLTLTVQVAAAATGTLSATATASSGSTDPNAGNNAATADTAIGAGSADLSVTLGAAPATIAAGGTVVLTATGSNAGPSDAQTVVITIALGPNLRFSSVNPGAGGICTTPAVGATGNVVCTYAGATPPGTNRVVVVNATAPSASTANVTATISSATPDPQPGNATAAAVVTVTGTAAPAQPVLVPATAPLALLMLGLLLGLVGVALVRRQS